MSKGGGAQYKTMEGLNWCYRPEAMPEALKINPRTGLRRKYGEQTAVLVTYLKPYSHLRRLTSQQEIPDLLEFQLFPL